MKFRLATLLTFLVLASSVFAQTPRTETGSKIIQSEVVYKGSEVIWGMDFVSPREMIFTTRPGKFFLFDINTKKARAVTSELQVIAKGQGGLLDVKVHPDFTKNSFIYFTYSCGTSGPKNTTCLGRGVLDTKDSPKLTKLEVLFSAQPSVESNQHFGSRITWGPQGTLWLSMGERFSQKEQAQNLKTHLGKVLRLTMDGKAAPGNPFEKDPRALPEIWTYGHRNTQGLFYESATQRLWQGEQGPQGGDEINLLQPGKNYGWPIITYGEEYGGGQIGEGKEKAGMQQPVKFYVPSIANSSLIVYSGKKYADWKGDLFQGSLVLQHLNHVIVTNGKLGTEERFFTNLGERIRNVIESPEGDLFFSTDSGKIYRLTR